MLAALGGAPLIASMRPAVITGASRSVLCSGPLHCANAIEFGGAATYGGSHLLIHGQYAISKTTLPPLGLPWSFAPIPPMLGLSTQINVKNKLLNDDRISF